VPESRRALGALLLGLLAGIAGGWLAGLLRAPKPTPLTTGAPQR
jgi:hypothetical protein